GSSSSRAAPPDSERKAEASRTMRRFKFEDFDIGEVVGNGSYGQVFKAIHKTTGEVFAMKDVPKQKILEHQMTSYLTREVRTQILLTHPGILRPLPEAALN
ncbi:unnamed protein product, partial [Polarella glacialis]